MIEAEQGTESGEGESKFTHLICLERIKKEGKNIKKRRRKTTSRTQHTSISNNKREEENKGRFIDELTIINWRFFNR